MTAADRELIRLTAQIYIERFKKWPEDTSSDETQHIEQAALVAREIMKNTYGKEQDARIRNLDKELEFFREQNLKLQEMRSLAENIIEKLDNETNNRNVMAIMRFEYLSKGVPAWESRSHPNGPR